MNIKLLFFASVTMLLVGCGGGSSSSSTPTPTKVTNNPPVASDDDFNVGMNVSSILEVLANDSDQDSFSIANTTEPTNGTILVNGEEIVYTPTNGFTGEDSFTYTILDSAGNSDTANVTLRVANIAPSTQTDIVELWQSQVIEISALDNDVSIAGHELTILSISVPQSGVAVLEDNKVAYRPHEGFVGTDALVYVVEDSFGDESTGSIEITVNNVVPTVVADTGELSQNQSVTIDVLANDSDALGDELKIKDISGVSHGAAVIDNNKIVYTPDAGFAGAETIIYTVEDNYQAEQEGELLVTVNNVLPVAGDDSAVVKMNNSIVIDVLANDQDVVGDELTIQTVSAATSGVVKIENGKINYTPNTGFEGVDTFNYTTIDSFNAADSGEVKVSVYGSIMLQGQLIGYQRAGVEVKVFHNGNWESVLTDSLGQYELTLDFVDTDDMLVLYADNAAENYHLRAYIGSLAGIVQDNANGKTYGDVNLSDLTTAEYELINILLSGEEAETVPELITSQFSADSAYQLKMAVAAKLVNQNNGLDLPVEFSSVNEFIRATKKMSQQLARWRDEQALIYDSAFDEMFNNDLITQFPERIEDGDYSLFSPPGESGASTALIGHATRLSISATGAVYRERPAVKTITSKKLRIQVLELPKYSYVFKTYCDSSDYSDASNAYISEQAFEITKIYSTSTYDVYMRKMELSEQSYLRCLDINRHLYSVFRHYHHQPFSVSPSEYVLDTFRPHPIEAKREDSPYLIDIGNVELNSDGSFVDQAENGEIYAGNWLYDNNSLILNYDNEMVVSYYKVAEHDNEPLMYVTLHGRNGYYAGTYTYFREIGETELPFNEGYLEQAFSYPFDTTLSYIDRIAMHENGQYTSQRLSEDFQWNDLYTNSWRRNDKLYEFGHYFLNDSRVDFCDASENDCEFRPLFRYEFISEKNGKYLARRSYDSYDQESDTRYWVSYLELVNFVPK